MDQPSLFDLPQSVAARDTGIKKVLDHNKDFAASLRAFVISLPVGWVGTGEDVRKIWTGAQPSSPNAWGGVIGGLARSGHLELTGVRLRMTGISSHARKTDQYRRTAK